MATLLCRTFLLEVDILPPVKTVMKELINLVVLLTIRSSVLDLQTFLFTFSTNEKNRKIHLKITKTTRNKL